MRFKSLHLNDFKKCYDCKDINYESYSWRISVNFSIRKNLKLKIAGVLDVIRDEQNQASRKDRNCHSNLRQMMIVWKEW